MSKKLLPMACLAFLAWAGFCDSGKLAVRDRRILHNLAGVGGGMDAIQAMGRGAIAIARTEHVRLAGGRA